MIDISGCSTAERSRDPLVIDSAGRRPDTPSITQADPQAASLAGATSPV